MTVIMNIAAGSPMPVCRDAEFFNEICIIRT
jgi:hypothetical protein